MSDQKMMPIITIGRQYAAGGHLVAKQLSERLNIPFYDVDVVKLTAKQSGYTEDDVRQFGEEMSEGARFIKSFLSTPSLYTSAHDAVFRAEREVILDLAKKGPVIIVGRCSNAILRDIGIPTFDIFLYADKQIRMKRAEELAENESMVLDRFVEKRDHLRNTYYKNYTGHDLSDSRDYNICLDTGVLGTERCVDILAAILLSTYKTPVVK